MVSHHVSGRIFVSSIPASIGALIAATAGIALCFLSPSPAAAQQGNATGQDSLVAAAAPRQKLDQIEIAAQRLDSARNRLSPDTGSSVYTFGVTDIAKLPLGDSTPMNQVILQAPGAVQDSYGQLHVRGDHSNLQYRIDGVVIPEAIGGFGQALDARFAERINVLTGALPAQYGYRTAGIVDITTKSVATASGGSASVVGGSDDHTEAGAEVYGSRGAWSYYLTGSDLSDGVGIENPTAARDALHDDTRQRKGFGYLSYLLGADSRLRLMAGASESRFQIPDVAGQSPAFALDPTFSAAPPDSAKLDARQDESSSFEVLSLQKSAGDDVDLLVSLFHRSSAIRYRPDIAGELVFNGIAANISRTNDATGVQADASIRLGETHALRSGLYASRERAATSNDALVFAADADGNQTSDVPFAIADDARLTGRLRGVYLQDEWTLGKELTLNYGARYDRTSGVVSEQQLSPRVGLVYDLSRQVRVHAGYARYFTPPPTEKIDSTSVQKFLGTTNALPSDANTSVASERSHYFDAGLSYQATRDLTLGVDTYYRKVRNLQDEGQFGKALIYSAFNFARGRVRGVELSATYRRDGASGYLNLAWSKAEGRDIATGQFNFDPEELGYIADHWVHLDHDQTLSGSAGVALPIGGATLSGDLLYGSGLRRGFANTEHLPGYVQVNLGAVENFRIDSIGAVEARLALVNAFDRSYQLRDGSGIGVGAPQYAPRRRIYLGASKSFE